MEILRNHEITAAGLSDWRKLAQGLHARFVTSGLHEGARFVAAVAEDDDAGLHLRATIGDTYVDLRLVSQDADLVDREGVEHVIEWVTQRDVDLARAISAVAAEHGLRADPGSITSIELALDTPDEADLAPLWAAVLTGSTEAQGRGSTGNDVRDGTGRVPVLWFQDTDADEPRQHFHLDVWVAPEEAAARIAAAVAAGGTVVDDSEAPSFTVIADRDGNKVCVCTSLDPA